MKNIIRQYDAFIVGYYGMQNTGDDALLASSVWGAQHYLHAKKMAISCCEKVNVLNEHSFEPTLKYTQTFPGQNRLLRYGKAIQSNTIIFGGGSVFHTTQDIEIKRHLMRFAKKNEHRAIGVGIGPFKDTSAELSCAKFLNECHFTGVRDIASLDIAKSIAPNANISLTFDLAPLLLCSYQPPIKNNRKNIAVSLCPKESLEGNEQAEIERAKSIAKALVKIHQCTGETIHFININGHPDLGDEKIHKIVIRFMPDSIPTKIIKYDPNPINVLNCLAQFKAILSMRLHGSILSYLVNTPVISLNYHSKCDGWCEQVGMPSALRIDLSQLDGDFLAENIISGLENGFEQNTLNVSDAIKQAKMNWSDE